LSASCIGGIVAFFIIGHYEGSLSKFAYLAAFIPVIMGMGGNIGTQTSTIVVRGLATGRLNIRDTWSVVFKEFAVGFMLGMIYGLLVGSVAQLRYSMFQVAISVGIAVVSSMSIAALVGSLVPMGFAKINIDPAIASGPFVTTAIDIISVAFYFIIATALLGI
jgi:magnesium transporter